MSPLVWSATMRVAAITGSELRTASDILIEAARWLSQRGEPMWHERDLRPKELLGQCSQEEIYLGWRGGKAVAVMVLQWSDRVFWPDAPTGSSAFIHKLAVRRAWAGRGIAGEMIRWAMAESRERGADFLRLDCAADRPRLCAVYEQLGFQCVGRREVGSFDTALYELRLT